MGLFASSTKVSPRAKQNKINDRKGHSVFRGEGRGRGTLFDHFSDGRGGIDFHGGKVIESIYFTCILAKLLTKCIRQVVCWIRADEQDTFPHFGELYG